MTQFVLGLMLSVPLAVLANVATPIVLNRAARHSEQRSRRRVEVLRRELQRTTEVHNTPGALTEHLMVVVLGIIAIFAVAAFVSGVIYTSGDLAEAAISLGQEEETLGPGPPLAEDAPELTEEQKEAYELLSEDFVVFPYGEAEELAKEAAEEEGLAGWYNDASRIIYPAAQLITLTGVLVITVLSMNALRLARRVRNFEEYRLRVEGLISSLSGGVADTSDSGASAK